MVFIFSTIVLILFVYLLVDSKKVFYDSKKVILEKNAKAYSEYQLYQYYSNIETENKQLALLHISRAIHIVRNDKYYLSRGNIRKSMNQNHLALSDLNESLLLNPNNTLALYSRGQVHRLLNNMHNAYNDWNLAKELGSVDAEQALDRYFKNFSIEITNPSAVLSMRNWVKSKEREIKQYNPVFSLLAKKPISQINYRDLLNCYDWQVKRFEILIRDKFRCCDCGELSEKLHVHHKYYIKDLMPWEIDSLGLVSLCRGCHNKRHEKEIIKVYKNVGDKLFLTDEYADFCFRCYNTGYIPQYGHVENGICFLCRGENSKTIFSKRLIALSKIKQNIFQSQKSKLSKITDEISIDYYLKYIYKETNYDNLPF